MTHTELLRLMAEHMVAGTTDTKAQVAGKIRQHLFATRPNPDLPGDVVERSSRARAVAILDSVEWAMDNFLPAKGESSKSCERRRLIEEITAELDATTVALTAASADLKPVREALEAAERFIAEEYADPQQEEYGGWLAPEAVEVHTALCQALSSINREQK